MPLRDTLGVERLDFLIAREPTSPPCLTSDLVSRRAAERAGLASQGRGGCRLARGQHGRQALMKPIQ